MSGSYRHTLHRSPLVSSILHGPVTPSRQKWSLLALLEVWAHNNMRTFGKVENSMPRKKKKKKNSRQDLWKGNNLFYYWFKACKHDNSWTFGIMVHTWNLMVEERKKYHKIYFIILKYLFQAFWNKFNN